MALATTCFSICLLVSLFLTSIPKSSHAQTPTSQQISSGWCSPKIAAHPREVTVVCEGVDPPALKRLNDRLEKPKTKPPKEQVDAADAWTARYKELEPQLSKASSKSPDMRHAAESVQAGNFDAAETYLEHEWQPRNRTLPQAISVEGQLVDMTFRHSSAFPQCELDPHKFQYAAAYAEALELSQQFPEAEKVTSA